MQENAAFLREDAARTERHKHLTEALSDYDRNAVETLLDNIDRVIKEENSTAAIGTAAYTTTAKPLTRRIYVDSVARELVSVQPMTQPTEKLFFLDFIFDTDFAPTVAGDRMDYQALKHNRFYASGTIRGEVVGVGDGADLTFNTKWYPVKPGSLTVYVNSVAKAVTAFTPDTGAFTVAAPAPAIGASITVDYQLVMEGLGSKGNAVIPGLELAMSSATIDVESKKFKYRLTKELEQDLQAYQKLSAQQELRKHMGREMTFETDRMIIEDLLDAASATNINWSKTVPAAFTQKDWYETLLHAVGDASNEIFKKRLVHANFVVMGPDTATRLGKINAIRLLNPEGNVQRIVSGPNVFGTLESRYKVIVDPLFPADKILVGHKGESWLSTGYVFGPYTTFETEVFLDPNTMKMVKGLMHRFGRYLVSGDFYATVTLTA